MLIFSYYSQNQRDATNRARLNDPPVVTQKGRPLTQRITGAAEGRPRGGGAKHTVSGTLGMEERGPQATSKRQGVCCGVCREVGHNQTTCPILHC